jgi:membrane protein
VIVLWRILKRASIKFFDDNGPLLASGLAFDLLLFCIPFSFLVVSALGYAIGSSDRALEMLQGPLQELLPLDHAAFTANLAMALDNRGLLGVLGFSLFFLTSSATFGSVRTVLNTVFQVQTPVSFLKAKATDFLIIFVASGLLFLMISLTSLLSLAKGILHRWPFMERAIEPGWAFSSDVLGFLFALALFYLLYRFCPSQRLRRPATLVAAFTGAALFELSKWVFAWYVSVSHYSVALYGAVGGLFFFLMWIYYASAVLIVGGEVGWVLQEELGGLHEAG